MEIEMGMGMEMGMELGTEVLRLLYKCRVKYPSEVIPVRRKVTEDNFRRKSGGKPYLGWMTKRLRQWRWRWGLDLDMSDLRRSPIYQSLWLFVIQGTSVILQ